MNEIVCRGLDGNNPLHALAAFGLLRIADRLCPRESVRLGWRMAGGAWRAVLCTEESPDSLLPAIASSLVTLSLVGNTDIGLTRGVRMLNAEAKALDQQIRDLTKKAKAEAKTLRLDKTSTTAHIESMVSQLRNELHCKREELAAAQGRQATVNGSGIAHLGEMISVAPSILRAMVSSAVEQVLCQAHSAAALATDDPRLVIAQMAALACDQIHEGGKLTPTPFSFSNGASGQCLLKDFRACAAAVTKDLLAAALDGSDTACVSGRTGLNWDPDEQVSYALAWADPATTGKAAPVATNALAYLGLSLLPCLPMGSRLGAVAWGPGKAFTWPIWETALSLDATMALLAYGGPDPDAASLRARGIVGLQRAQVVNPTGKRNFFAPSRPVA